jgi:hypothetical protein
MLKPGAKDMREKRFGNRQLEAKVHGSSYTGVKIEIAN